MIAAAAAIVVLSVCGGDDASTLDRADDALAELRSGEALALQLAATAGDGDDQTEPVGFTLEGSFDLDAGETYPILDLTYTRQLAGDEQELGVRSDGDVVVVTSDDEEIEVPADQAAPLRKGDGDGGITEGLGIAGWIADADEESGPEIDGVATTRVHGTADAADLLDDIAAITAQVTGETELAPLSDEDAERLQQLVRSSEVDVLVGDDDVPRSLTATLAFGSAVPDELRAALGCFAGAQLEIRLTISSPG